MIKLNNVSAHYGHIEALKGIDIEINEGKIISILGANGAGKTSTLAVISRLLDVTTGTVTFNGKSLLDKSVEEVVSLGIVQSPEGRRIFKEMTVYENLLAGGYILKSKDALEKNIRQVFDYFPRLEERKNQNAGTLSGGEQQMLAIGRALMSSPKILLLDEPSLGLAPLIVADIFRIIKEINAKGTTVVLVEQNAYQALKISDYSYVLATGEIVYEGDSKKLQNNTEIKKAYLGS